MVFFLIDPEGVINRFSPSIFENYCFILKLNKDMMKQIINSKNADEFFYVYPENLFSKEKIKELTDKIKGTEQ
jgi:hypothetical protein